MQWSHFAPSKILRLGAGKDKKISLKNKAIKTRFYEHKFKKTLYPKMVEKFVKELYIIFIYFCNEVGLVICQFYPPKGRAQRTRWGPLDSLSNLICV